VCGSSSDNNAQTIVENCVNHGSVEGNNAYGISDTVSVANNVVNLGVVTGSSDSYSFWKTSDSTPTMLFGLNSACSNCDDNVTKIVKSDGYYHTVGGDKTRVDTLLNEESENKGYSNRWDDELILRKIINVKIGGIVNKDMTVLGGLPLESTLPKDVLKYHFIPKGLNPSSENEISKSTIIEDDIELIPYRLIKITGEITKTIYIMADTAHYNLDDNSDLKKYLSSKDYAIGDNDSRALLSGDSEVDGDISIIVMKKNIVVIDMEEEAVLAADVNTKEIAESVSALTGIGVENILVDIDVDEAGYVIRIIVIVQDYEMSENVASSINELVKDKSSQCNYGVLCRSKSARIVVGDLSVGYRINYYSYILFYVVIFLYFFLF